MNNSAPSIRARLLNIAKKLGEDFNYVLLRYAMERLLYRIGKSKYRERFILKGASLFLVWNETVHRKTRDIDMLGYGDCTTDTLRICFDEILTIQYNDGIVFDITSIQTEYIKEHDDYHGVRLTFHAYLDRARIPMIVEIGTGDIVFPIPEMARYPVLLPANCPPEILIYPVYTVLAEKLQTIITKGIINSRMKDFYDIWYLSKTNLDNSILKNAVQKTFTHRKTVLDFNSVIFSEMFFKDSQKLKQWKAFLIKNDLIEISLEDAVHTVKELFMRCS